MVNQLNLALYLLAAKALNDRFYTNQIEVEIYLTQRRERQHPRLLKVSQVLEHRQQILRGDTLCRLSQRLMEPKLQRGEMIRKNVSAGA